MGAISHVTTVDDARRLAAHLLDARRTHPVVVISHGVGRGDAPWIDPESVLAGVGDYAEVHVVPTGDVTWELGACLPPEAQVYGDAARVYSTDLSWVTRPRDSRLYLCFGPAQAARIEVGLVADAMQAALAAGLFERRPQRRTVTGRVTGVLAGRGVVEGDFGRAALRPELAVPGVPIERVVLRGQTVTGEWVTADGLLDVRGSLRSVDDALSGYRPGDAILVRVCDVGRDRVVVEPYPGTRVEIPVSGITGNPLDDPRDLMTVGEVVVAHVVRAGRWILSLADVDDDEPVREAPALLEGGPPWLVADDQTPADPVEAWSPPAVPADIDDRGLKPDAESEARVATGAADAERPAADRAPTPRDLDPHRGPNPVAPAPASPVSTGSDRSLTKELHLERGARAHAQRELEAVRLEMKQLVSRLRQLERERDRAQTELERKRTETRDLRKKLQKARPVGGGAAASSTEQFLEAEAAFKHDVYLAWVDSIPAADKANHPLPEHWSIGPDFLESLAALEGVARTKVAEVVVQVVTGIADTMPGRDMHRLRMGAGGDDPWVEREPGEYCWRVALQRNTPSARRLHFWRRGDAVELSRVALHDEVRP